jgi:hypothetical protein
MLNEKKPTEAIDFRNLGGRKIDHHVPEKPAEPIDLSHLGGRQIGGSFVPDKSKQIDLSELYGEHGGLVAHPAPEQQKDDID